MAHVMVRLHNVYECGRQSHATIEVPAPESVGLDHEQWWEACVYEYTGDGHGCGSSDNALYTAAIVGPADRYDLGAHHEWGG